MVWELEEKSIVNEQGGCILASQISRIVHMLNWAICLHYWAFKNIINGGGKGINKYVYACTHCIGQPGDTCSVGACIG